MAPGPRSRPSRRSSRDTVRVAGVLAGLVALMAVLLGGGTYLLERSMRVDPSEAAAPVQQPPQVIAPDAPLTDRQLRSGLAYVAMGDSYAAGPGLPVQDGDPAACKRSSASYPELLQAWLRVGSFTDVSCTGATADDLPGRQQRPDGTVVDPQLDALGASTGLVTLTLGGNDGGLVERLITTCLQTGPSDPHGHPCQDAFATGGTNAMTAAAEGLQADLVGAIRAIRARAPDAQVVVVGYPQLFPTDANCAQLPFALGDATFAAGVVATADQSLRSAAQAEGVRYVDTLTPSAGHDVCSADPWIIGVDAPAGGPEAWHPMAAGMAGIAGAVYQQLTGSPAPAGAARSGGAP